MSAQPSVLSRIVAAVDGSEESMAAADYAVELSKKMGIEVIALSVVQLPEYITDDVRDRLNKELASRAEESLKAVQEAARGKGVPISGRIVSTTGSVVDTICEFAVKEKAGMIVIGTRGRGGVAKLMLGSVAAGVARSALCPVLVVR